MTAETINDVDGAHWVKAMEVPVKYSSRIHPWEIFPPVEFNSVEDCVLSWARCGKVNDAEKKQVTSGKRLG